MNETHTDATYDCERCYDTGVTAEVREGNLYRHNCSRCQSDKSPTWCYDQPRYRLTYDNDEKVDRICEAPRTSYRYMGYRHD